MISSALCRSLLALSLLAAPAMTLTGCEEQGPLEKAGERADEAVRDAGRAVKDAAD